jgi:hypothetical protein
MHVYTWAHQILDVGLDMGLVVFGGRGLYWSKPPCLVALSQKICFVGTDSVGVSLFEMS